jgi:hypothetical protein
MWKDNIKIDLKYGVKTCAAFTWLGIFRRQLQAIVNNADVCELLVSGVLKGRGLLIVNVGPLS